MKAIRLIGTSISIVSLIVLGFFTYMGGFHSVEVREGNYGPQEIIFVTHKGSYQGLSKSWKEFQLAWEAKGLKECDSLSIYLDPPETPDDKLRSILGCKVSELPIEEKSKLQEHFQSFMIPGSEAFLSEFPFKNYFSFMLGPIKVYPKMEEAIKATSKIPNVAIEEYGIPGSFDEIKFVMPIWVDSNKFKDLEDSFNK